MKTALFSDVSGLDGAYLARLLLACGYRAFGTSRDPQAVRHHILGCIIFGLQHFGGISNY